MADGIGWDELINGNMVEAVYTMFNEAMASSGWPISILFFVYQFMLYRKTANFPLLLITGAMFASLYARSAFVEPLARNIMFVVLAIEAAVVFYQWIFK